MSVTTPHNDGNAPMRPDFTPISKYKKSNFSATSSCGQTICHDVYRLGIGPTIVLIQELPGIGKETLRLADKLINAGFEVALPHLFGPLEKISIVRNTLRVFCMRQQFKLFARNQTSPIVDWLKALCQSIRKENGSSGVGVMGMCLTGNFAISLMADDSVLASVAAQPSMPLLKQSSLHMSEEEISSIKRSIDSKGPMHALRFSGDKLCTAEKFDAIQNTFNDDRERIVLTTLPDNGHSVFTLDFVDQKGQPTHQALKLVIEYYEKQLKS